MAEFYHYHKYILNHFEHGIDKGICSCGAVKYFPIYVEDDVLERVAQLNGKPAVLGFRKEKKMSEPSIPGIEETAEDKDHPGLSKAAETPAWQSWGETEWYKVCETISSSPKGAMKKIMQHYSIPEKVIKVKYMRYVRLKKGKLGGRKSRIKKTAPAPDPTGPVKMDPVYVKLKSKEYESRREEILGAIKEYGIVGAAKKLNISRSTLSDLRRRWLGMPGNGLPAFNDSWEPAVQIQWLKTFEAVGGRAG